MVETIGNPLSFTARAVSGAGAHVAAMGATLGGDAGVARPRVRHIGVQDIRNALAKGLEDFAAMRSDVVAMCVLYPIVGLGLAFAAFHASLMPMIFPLVSGFALIGPFAALGLYQMSRKREAGGEATWADAFAVVGEPSFGAVLALGAGLIATFVVWLLVADGLYAVTLGPEPPVSGAAFLRDLFNTGAGHALIALGVVTGALFAALVLAVSLVSFPLLLDRNVGVPVAVVTSWQVARQNPEAAVLWGLIVASGLVLGAIPALLGLAVVIPVLGHATWHLYRAAVLPE